MILEHEIPQGSKLYYGSSARLKRTIEHRASEIFNEFGYTEILTPTFCYLEHQRNFKSRDIVRLSNESNYPISLRMDSTLDLVRIITKRLSHSHYGRKWFYIQPVFTYPTSEIHQIGLESLQTDNIDEVQKIAKQLVQSLNLPCLWQLSNLNIPRICSRESKIALEHFIRMDIPKLTQSDSYIQSLITAQTTADLKAFLIKSPAFLKDEIQILLEFGRFIDESQKVFVPLYHPKIPYYDSLFFRLFTQNATLLSGGQYEIQGITSSGFALYTDAVIDSMLQGQKT